MKPKRLIIFSNIYFPGLISIVLLPLIGIIYFYFYQVKYAMPVTWFDKAGIERVNKLHSTDVDLEKFRSYTKIYLTGDQSHDKNELIRLPSLLDKLLAKDDTKNGISVFLASKTRYQELVTTLDIGYRYQALSVIPYYNKIFIFKFAHDSRSLIAASGKGLLFDDLIFITYRETFLEKVKRTFDDIIPLWPILIPFGGMVYFGKRRRNSGVMAPV